MTINEQSLALHEELKGKLSTEAKCKVNSREALALAYTPGVAEPCKAIAANPEEVYRYTIKSNTVAVISDGSAVLGLGNIGAAAAMPVMEGKCVLFKVFSTVGADIVTVPDIRSGMYALAFRASDLDVAHIQINSRAGSPFCRFLLFLPKGGHFHSPYYSSC